MSALGLLIIRLGAKGKYSQREQLLYYQPKKSTYQYAFDWFRAGQTRWEKFTGDTFIVP